MTATGVAAAPSAGRQEAGAGVAGGALVGAVALACVALLFVTGRPEVAAAPILAVAGAYAFARLPLRHTVLALLAATLTVDIPAERPTSPPWGSPLHPIGAVLFENLNKTTGVAALRFSGAELLLAALVLLLVARRMSGATIDRAGRVAGANVMRLVLATAFMAVLALEVRGILRGGDFRQSLWQVRGLLWLTVLGAFFDHALRGLRDLAAAGRVVVAAACVKVFIGLYFYLAVARPQGIVPAHVTSHQDSVLFVAVIVACVAAWVHRPTLPRLAGAAALGGWMMVGLVINNRRIAFVSLFACLVVLYALLRGPVKRSITRCALACLPLLLAYVAAGRHRTTGVFAPAASIVSVIQQKDASSGTRDIENYNLLVTLKQHQLLGAGWGHEYVEQTKGYDISRVFEQYRFIAHNSVLWLWTVGGLVGFTLLWLPLPVGVFLAARSYHFARTPGERTAAVSALAVIVSFVIQAWGDMGTQGWIGVFLVACALAASAKLAVATGAWPSDARLFSRPRRAALRASAN